MLFVAVLLVPLKQLGEFDLEIGRPARSRELGQLSSGKTAKFSIE